MARAEVEMDVGLDLNTIPTEAPSPFLKWVGGKSRLISQFEPYFPEEHGRYFEPFVGGGAVFFRTRPEDARLSDVNARLIEAYRAVRDDLPALVDRLQFHQARHDSEYYYRARTRMNAPRGLNATERAALMMYLNKTCFNGLYRENRRGEFNVPIGRYKSPNICDIPGLVAASRQLQGVSLDVAGFDSVLQHAKRGDLVYFDPPYVPVSATSSFTSYSAGGFAMSLQHRLAQVFAELAQRGVYVMLSNSDCPEVRELYAGWRVVSISASRSINSRKDGRGKVGEVLVLGW